MSRKSKYSGEEKYDILIEYKNSNLTISQISDSLGHDWLKRYNSHRGLKSSGKK
jgi:transposase-like protein